MSDDDEQPSTVPSDHPVDSDNNLIEWDDNNASLGGILHELDLYYQRTQIFIPLIEHNASQLSNGKLAVESLNCIPFITGEQNDPRSFVNPCPAIAARITQYDARTGSKAKTDVKIDDDTKYNFTLSASLTVRCDVGKHDKLL